MFPDERYSTQTSSLGKFTQDYMNNTSMLPIFSDSDQLMFAKSYGWILLGPSFARWHDYTPSSGHIRGASWIYGATTLCDWCTRPNRTGDEHLCAREWEVRGFLRKADWKEPLWLWLQTVGCKIKHWRGVLKPLVLKPPQRSLDPLSPALGAWICIFRKYTRWLWCSLLSGSHCYYNLGERCITIWLVFIDKAPTMLSEILTMCIFISSVEKGK